MNTALLYTHVHEGLNSCVFLEADDNASWNIINAADSWEDKHIDGENGSDEDYVLVNQEDVVDSIANFMAAYLLSLKKTKVCLISYKN